MAHRSARREFVRDLGIGAAALPFVLNLPSLGFANQQVRKQRLVVMFSPNGVVPSAFWPDGEGPSFQLKEIMKPLELLKNRTLVLHGLCDKLKGDGDNHMRGMGCLLTGIELFPGNIQGGSDTPAGWAKGLSIDQEIKNHLQSRSETRTRFGSLEFGVMVPDRADTWTRMVYAGANKPIAPIDDPYQMLPGKSSMPVNRQPMPRMWLSPSPLSLSQRPCRTSVRFLSASSGFMISLRAAVGLQPSGYRWRGSPSREIMIRVTLRASRDRLRGARAPRRRRRTRRDLLMLMKRALAVCMP